jgi:uncharacterized protein (UPF0548 family)
MIRDRRLHRERALAALRDLEDLDFNCPLPQTTGRTPSPSPSPSPGKGWHIDTVVTELPSEAPGAAVPGGPFEIACRLVRDYRFAEPSILRALFRADAPLYGRNMLLEGRFCGMRFDMGVRVTSVTDGTHGAGETASRVWGWGYRTLQGHLEEGELRYEVVKRLRTGEVTFVMSGYSRRAPVQNPAIRFGFRLFGRLTQRRFHRLSARRLHRLLLAELNGAPPRAYETHPSDNGVVIAPGRG